MVINPKLLNTLEPPKLCVCCRMELLPVLIAKDTGSGLETSLETPKVFCDEICERMFKLYPKVFKTYRGINME